MEISPFYQELVTALNRGLVMSLALIVPSAIGGVMIGISAGALRVFGQPWVRRLGDGYAALFVAPPWWCSCSCSTSACPISASTSALTWRR